MSVVIILTLSAPWEKSWSLADGIDQDQTAQNVQPNLVKSDICASYLWDSVGPIYCRRKRSVLNIWR